MTNGSGTEKIRRQEIIVWEDGQQQPRSQGLSGRTETLGTRLRQQGKVAAPLLQGLA